jgi:predicted membrane channel-forming protein YqfA (hemolysin III family)
METSMIEKLDNARSSFLKWATVGYTIWFGTYIVADPFFLPEIPSVIQWIRILGWLILVVSGIRAMKLKRELRWDKKMQGALEGELHQYNLHKSFQMGFFVVMGITAVFLMLSLFYTIPALLVTKVILYLGGLAVLISKMFYNRD